MGIWWRPDRLAWWTGLLFAAGSLLFLVPAVAALSSNADWIGVTFFCGSICFTSAALLQLVAASEAPHRAPARGAQAAAPARVAVA